MPRSSGPSTGLPSNPTGWLITAASAGGSSNGAAIRPGGDASGFCDRAAGDPDGPGNGRRSGRHADALPAVRAPVAEPRGSGRAYSARRGRSDDWRDRQSLLVPEATVAQRISRAKQRIRASGAEFRMPPAAELPARMSTLCRVLYMIFNEGHTASAGTALHRVDLDAEGDPADQAGPCAAPERRRGCRLAGADADDRRAAARPQ